MIPTAHAQVSPARTPAFRRLFSTSLALLALLLALTPALRAQENATINGTVTDASGAVVANA